MRSRPGIDRRTAAEDLVDLGSHWVKHWVRSKVHLHFLLLAPGQWTIFMGRAYLDVRLAKARVYRRALTFCQRQQQVDVTLHRLLRGMHLPKGGRWPLRSRHRVSNMFTVGG